MSRFDEFRDSLKGADRHLEAAVDFMEDDDFDNDDWRHGEACNEMLLAYACLKSAYQDICDDVGIRSDGDALKELYILTEQVTDKVRANAGNRFLRGYVRSIQGYVRSIRGLQRDLADILRASW